jgi:hypothetical protein
MAKSAVRDEDGLLRVNYFFGQVLGVDFTAEQNYLREKFRRLNRLLHGVVSGDPRRSVKRSGTRSTERLTTGIEATKRLSSSRLTLPLDQVDTHSLLMLDDRTPEPQALHLSVPIRQSDSTEAGIQAPLVLRSAHARY